jgi:hypothetical protein
MFHLSARAARGCVASPPRDLIPRMFRRDLPRTPVKCWLPPRAGSNPLWQRRGHPVSQTDSFLRDLTNDESLRLGSALLGQAQEDPYEDGGLEQRLGETETETGRPLVAL